MQFLSTMESRLSTGKLLTYLLTTYTVSQKNIRQYFSSNLCKNCPILILLADVTSKLDNQCPVLAYFPISASQWSCTTWQIGKHEIPSFHTNYACKT